MKRQTLALELVVILAFLIGGCTSVVHLRDQKTGQAVTCGGELWTPTSAAQDRHCLDYFRRQGFEVAE